ncbi:MAG: TIGR02530 family flagellar biosynthesis protein [Planctomycetota bacterium]
MTSRMDALSRALSIGAPPLSAARTAPRPSAAGEDFLSILKARIEAEAPGRIRFSRHAAARLEERNIRLTAGDLDRLNRATDRAAAKGVREAFVMMGQVHLIVSVQNRTVVTAMPVGETDDAIYTNIDAAVMVGQDTEGIG